MDYLETAVALKQLIAKTNEVLLDKNKGELTVPNKMLVRTNFGNVIETTLGAFTNVSVRDALKEYESEAFVITDFVATEQQGQELSYFLYKGYSRVFDKGLVFFQLVNKETFEPVGKLEFSNIEDNIFYEVIGPKHEESSCNALETKDNTAKNPCVAFLISHMNEERLLYDINRLIFETANNVQKHKNRNFKFIIQIDKNGGELSEQFKVEIDKMAQSLEKNFKPEYPNCEFVFAVG